MSCTQAHGRLEVLQIYRLLQYIHENHKERIAWMVELGVENLINLTEPKDGLGVLHVAVSANNHELVSFLLSLGAHPNVQDKRGRTPTMLAAQLGNEHIVSVLMDNRADLSLQDAGGHGVLFYCIYPTKRHARCLQVALKGDADVNNVSSEGVHVFQRMCEKAEECAPLCFDMLEAGADPNAANRTTGVTALMSAVKAGCLQLVRAILRRGGDPNALSTERLSALHLAAMGGSLEAIQVLSAYSANMGVLSMDICTPLHYAAASGDANCCRFLAQRGCNPKVKNKDDVLPRQIAKDSGHKAAAKELRKAEKKSATNRPTSSPWTLTLYDWSQENQTEIRQACGEGLDTVSTEKFISVIENLRAPVDTHQLSEVISANDKKREGLINLNDFIKGVNYIDKPFLHSSYVAKKKKKGKGAAKGGGKKKKKGKKKGKCVLLMPICTRPPELMARRPDGGPPHFMMEMYTNSSDVRRFDRHHPPEHPLANDSGWYMEKPRRAYVDMASCVKNGDLQTVDLALSQGVPVDVKDTFYKMPLMVACSSGNVEMVQYLLRKGADVNTCDQFFWTPLHHAAHAGHMEIMKLLLEAGATVDAIALNGGTPLMRAIESSRSSCVELLIKAGANVALETEKGQNCLDVATDFADSKIINLVKDKMDSLLKIKEPKRKGLKPKSAKAKGAAAPTDTHSVTAGPTPLKKDSKSIVLQNAHITTGRTNAVDITFVPKTVWGKPPTTSQLMSQMEEPYSLLTS
ncbi:ankyrin repeat and EF-hand domain-containing protein 1 [Gouania willdenowi]|uniref:ankyrin repeat and EF-hand domain-containing protein 1 n=1 Tax=Gouania willdenowi TaxID=441366 RepID=UPI001056C300|nr:ankyrin repeat and EF-hand domain-containing protein 1 [Gouania willdenowi]XP_028295299.1 ankyrin repeat and EF-hand domain-containing protein 1 [Gouania willdenowi]XP_028295300.1 ankyrin repeat and EF-hand domain-containing protein 1 [Gouania willdenowi]